jgi:hypothetical protein
MHRYSDNGKTIEIVVDPFNTVVRPATPEDKKNYPQHVVPAPAPHDDRHHEKHEDKKK